MGTSWLLPRLIGASRSHELMLTGRRVDAEEALRIGLVADVVGEARLLERALEAAGQMAALAPWGVRLTKRGIWTALEIPSEQAAVEYEDRQQIMSTFGKAVPEPSAPSWRSAPRSSATSDGRAFRRLRQDGARDRRLARDRPDDRPRPGAGGRRVIVSSRKSEDVQAAAQELASTGECHPIACDISTQEGARALADATQERFKALDILVNNAGATWGAPLEEFPASGWEKVARTNVEGVFHLTVALLPALRASASSEDPARVINIGSIDGLRTPALENYSYSASKAAVHMLTRHLAKRLAAENITVNAIAPGPFESKMMAFLLEQPDTREAVERTVPLGRIGRPEDVAGLTLFLARAGSYLTGTVIPLDGGITGCN